MRFPYSSIIAAAAETGDYLLLRRPEIPVTIWGPSSSATFVGLVDTGSDNTIFPKSVADYLWIPVKASGGPAANAFGGYRIQLLTGEAILQIETEGEGLRWRTVICFYDFPSAEEETVILGHAGFLDYFTAAFDGRLGTLTLDPNEDLPNG